MIRALRLVFWGGVLRVVDFRFNGISLLDWAGMLLVTFGVALLARLPTTPGYRRTMRFVLVVVILDCVDTLYEHLPITPPAPFATLLTVLAQALTLLVLAAMLVFCSAQRQASRRLGLTRAATSWQTTILLCLVIWVIPVVAMYAVAVVAGFVQGDFTFDYHTQNPFVAVPLLAVALSPLGHFFLSTSRMQRDLQQRTGTDVSRRPA
jgi:hypothetical protein